MPGCNMAFRKSALEEIGGFDERFRVAGDDVDICWRLQEVGPHARLQRRRGGHAPPPRLGPPLPQAAVRLRQGRGAAGAQVAEPLQPRRLLALVGPDLRLAGAAAAAAARRWSATGPGAAASSSRSTSRRPAPLSSFLAAPERCLLIALLGVLSLLGAALVAAAARPAALRDRARRDRLGAPSTAGWRAHQPRAGTLAGRRRAAPRSSPRCSSSCSRSRASRAGCATASRPGAGACGRRPPGRGRARSRSGASAGATPQAWLQGLQDALAARGGFVRSGGPFDRWDLDLRAGPLGGVKIRTAVEEHGSGQAAAAGEDLAPRHGGRARSWRLPSRCSRPAP